MFKNILSLAAMILLCLSTKNSNAQEDSSKADLMEFFLNPYSFDSPDSSFLPMTEQYGFENKALAAKIGCMAFPGKLDKMRSDNSRTDVLGRPPLKLIDSLTLFEKNKEYFISIFELPETDTKPEVSYMISISSQFNKSTASVFGIYPKSKDKLLREKFIKAGMTIRHD